MTRKCCVPNCMTNAKPTATDDRKHLRRPCFGFPVDDELCKDWLERIPRNDFFRTKHSGVCILHFEPHYIKFINRRHTLSRDAIPTLFESDPFMESETNFVPYPQHPQHNFGINNQQNANYENFNPETDITDFDYLRSHLSVKLKLDNWMIAVSGQSILIFNLNKQSSGQMEGELSVRSTININENLGMKVFVKGVVIFNVKISKWTQIQNIIDKLQIKTDVENDMGFELDSLVVVKSSIDEDIDMKPQTLGSSSDFHLAKPEEIFQQSRIQQEDLNIVVKVEPQSLQPEFEGYFFNEEQPKHAVDINVNANIPNVDAIGKIYTCNKCNKEFDHHIRFMLHMRRHDPKECKPCPICNVNVYGKMSRHLKTHEEKSYECDVCNAVYKSKSLLNEHRQFTHFPGEFYCDICNCENLKTKSRLRRHMQKHIYNVTVSKPPPDIEHHQMEWVQAKQNNTQKVLEVEVKGKGSPTKKLSNVCTSCGKSFLLAQQLRNHMKRHDQSRWKECPICKKLFPDGLTRHINTHLKVKDYVCDICGGAYSQSYNLKVHKETSHFADKEFFCDICKNGFIYRSREHLRMHLKSHIRKARLANGGVVKSGPNAVGKIPKMIYSCVQCEATYTTSTRLKTHTMTVHTEDTPFQCLECNKKFAYKGLLVSHERVHATVNKFTCHQCGKSFKLANYLRKHLLRHKGEANKRKICTICGKKYVNNVDLRLHLKKVHGIDRKTEQVPETVDPIST